MDTICTVPAQKLYEKALSERIAFHKVISNQWHIWIENELVNDYIKMVYSSTV
jgi:hypothetical protein